MMGTEFQVIPPVETSIAHNAAERLPEIHTDARTDVDLVTVWLKSHAGGSAHTRRAYDHAIENGASIALVSATLGHSDLKVTSVYAHARPEDSSSRFLKR